MRCTHKSINLKGFRDSGSLSYLCFDLLRNRRVHVHKVHYTLRLLVFGSSLPSSAYGIVGAGLPDGPVVLLRKTTSPQAAIICLPCVRGGVENQRFSTEGLMQYGTIPQPNCLKSAICQLPLHKGAFLPAPFFIFHSSLPKLPSSCLFPEKLIEYSHRTTKARICV